MKREEERNLGTLEETLDYGEEEKSRDDALKDEVFDNLRDEIGLIEGFTPEVFVKLTILYRRETKRWLSESKKLSPEKQQAYYEEANKSFFESFGTTEEEYVQYSQTHMDELNSFMSEHPELMKRLREE